MIAWVFRVDLNSDRVVRVDEDIEARDGEEANNSAQNAKHGYPSYVWEEATALQIVAGCEDDRWKDEVEEDRLVELEGSFAGEARRPVKNKGYQHSHENSDSWLMDTFDLGERWLTRLDSMMAAAMV